MTGYGQLGVNAKESQAKKSLISDWIRSCWFGLTYSGEKAGPLPIKREEEQDEDEEDVRKK